MKKFKPNIKQTKIHVYLNNNKDKLKELQKKYKVSISTIAETTTKILIETPIFFKESQIQEMQKINDIKKYYYTSKPLTNATTIKPKIKHDYIDQFTTNEKQILFTNILYHVATKFKNYPIEEKEQQKIYGKITNELNKKKEIYWDLNNQIRTQKRAMEIIGATKKWKVYI